MRFQNARNKRLWPQGRLFDRLSDAFTQDRLQLHTARFSSKKTNRLAGLILNRPTQWYDVDRSPKMEGQLPYAIMAARHPNIPEDITFQHPPQTGRKRQTQEVSQICPLVDF